MHKKFNVILSTIALFSISTMTFAADLTASNNVEATPSVMTTPSASAPAAPSAPSAAASITEVYANGSPIIIIADENNNATSIYKDSNGNGIVDTGETVIPGGWQKDFSAATIYGGSLNSDVSQSLITMIGGEVGAIYGGGNAQDGPATVNGATIIDISGGTVLGEVNGGNAGDANTEVNTNPISINVAGYAENPNGYNTENSKVFNTATNSEQNGAIKIGNSGKGINLASFTSHTFNIVDANDSQATAPPTSTAPTSPGSIALKTNATVSVEPTSTAPTAITTTGNNVIATITPTAAMNITFTTAPETVASSTGGNSSYVINGGVITVAPASTTGTATVATIATSNGTTSISGGQAVITGDQTLSNSSTVVTVSGNTTASTSMTTAPAASSATTPYFNITAEGGTINTSGASTVTLPADGSVTVSGSGVLTFVGVSPTLAGNTIAIPAPTGAATITFTGFDNGATETVAVKNGVANITGEPASVNPPPSSYEYPTNIASINKLTTTTEPVGIETGKTETLSSTITNTTSGATETTPTTEEVANGQLPAGSLIYVELPSENEAAGTIIATNGTENDVPDIKIVNSPGAALYSKNSADGKGTDIVLGAATNPFSDISPSSSYYSNIISVNNQGIMIGEKQPNGSVLFEPTADLTRAEVAEIIWKMTGQPTPSSPNSAANINTVYSDVPVPYWFDEPVAWVTDAGISFGYVGTGVFAPNEAILQYQLASVLYNYVEYLGKQKMPLAGDTKVVADPATQAETISDPTAAGVVEAMQAYDWAVQNGLLGTTLVPADAGATIPREQMAAIITEFQDKVNDLVAK